MAFINPQDFAPREVRYTGLKVKFFIKALQTKAIKKNMNISRRNTLDEITNNFETKGYVVIKEMRLLHKFWYNFIINDYVDKED